MNTLALSIGGGATQSGRWEKEPENFGRREVGMTMWEVYPCGRWEVPLKNLGGGMLA